MNVKMNFNNNSKKILWVLIFILACAVFAYMLLSQSLTKNNERYYVQGLQFLEKKDYQNAYFNFSSVKQGNEFYCPSKYRAALAAQNLYDKDSAVSMYKQVIEGCTGSLFEENSRYNLAKLYYEQKNYKKAKNLFGIVARSAEEEKYKIAANYFLAEIEAKSSSPRANIIKNHYLDYLSKAPDGKYAPFALNGVLNINVPLNTSEKYTLAAALYKGGRYDSAKKLFFQVPFEKSWFYLAMSAHRAGDFNQAKELLERGLTTFPDSLSEEDLHKAIDLYALYFPNKKSGYLKAVELLTPKRLAGGDYALYKYIGELPKKEKLQYYNKIVDLYPQGKFASDALWNLIYSQYKHANYAKVLKLGEEHQQRYSNTISAPRVLFFMAKAAEKQGQFSLSKGCLNKILSKYPDDYYSLRAKLILDGRKTAWTIKGKRHISEQQSEIAFPLEFCRLKQKDLETLKLLTKTKDWALLEDLLGDNLIVKSWVNYKAGNKALSIVQARDFIAKLENKPKFSDDVYKLAYPLYYVDDINKYSQLYNLDPYVILSIIREESHFDNNAKSYVGAGGLMQLMPDTASFIAAKYSLEYNPYLRNNVGMNISLGCAYFDYALNELNKKYLFAVAGYNGGHNAVKNWHNTLNYNDFDEFVEEVPYPETQTYIRKVFKSYWNYLNIYDRIEEN